MENRSQCELSIIIPIYNGERYLRDTLDSVIGQSFTNYELILVDDGSTDTTGVICEEYAQRDSRIKVLHQRNQGMSKARDAGYQMSLPDTSIAFLDGDDIFDSRMLEDMMKYKDDDLVYTCFINIAGSKMKRYQFKEQTNAEQMNGKEMLNRLFTSGKNSGNMGCLWGSLIKREFYHKMEPIIHETEDVLPQNYLNDVYCIPRFLYYAERVTLLNKVYVLHRVSKYTDSRLLKPNALHYELALANKMNLDFYKEKQCDYVYEKHMIGFYLTILKLWYQITTQEKDKDKIQKYVPQIQNYYDEYYSEFSHMRSESVSDKLIKWSIMLFHKNKTLWKLLVGDIRYGIMYRL